MPRFLNLAPKFAAHAREGKYNHPKQKFSLSSREEALTSPHYEASTWNSDDFHDVARPAQDFLVRHPSESSAFSQSDRDIIHLYGENSAPFQQHALGALFKDRETSDHEGFKHAGQADDSMASLIKALNKLNPSLQHDVSAWAPAPLEGPLTFRGAMMWNNDAEHRRYDAEGGGLVPRGSIVQNQTFMSTTASPGVAAEFMLRQRDAPATYRDVVKEYESADTFNSKRVIFKIDHKTGKNVAPYVAEPQAEILFNLDTPFEVKNVEKADIGYFVNLEELDAAGIKRARELSNQRTYDFQWGNTPLSNDQLHTRQRYTQEK